MTDSTSTYGTISTSGTTTRSLAPQWITVCVRRNSKSIKSHHGVYFADDMQTYYGKQIQVYWMDGYYRSVRFAWSPEWLKFKNNVDPHAGEY